METIEQDYIDNNNNLKLKILFLNKEIENLKKLFPQNNNIDKEIYFINLSDISLENLEFAFDSLKLNHVNKYFPTIFEIRKNALSKEARVVMKFLKKIQEQIINNNIEFKNLRIKYFLKNNGGWDSMKRKINTIKEEDFINLYVSTKI